MRSALSNAAALALSAALAAAGCRGATETAANSPAVNSPASTAKADAAQPSGDAVPHGDHNPRHGGVVMMKGDLHYELVLDRTGASHRLYFSDAVREELPASIARDVALTIGPKGG